MNYFLRRIRLQRALKSLDIHRDVVIERFEELIALGLMGAQDGLLSKAGHRRLLELNALGVFDEDSEFWVWSSVSTRSELTELCNLHQTDKGATTADRAGRPRMPHTYTDVYESLLAGRRQGVRAVLEVGIYKGASLRVWRDYFPHAEIFGADIDRSTFIDEERIHCGWLDQRDAASVRAFLQELHVPEFDVIIDDGLHEFEANRMLFANTFDRLVGGGLYFLEDCTAETREQFCAYLDSESLQFSSYSGFRRGRHKLADNSMIVVTK